MPRSTVFSCAVETGAHSALVDSASASPVRCLATFVSFDRLESLSRLEMRQFRKIESLWVQKTVKKGSAAIQGLIPVFA